MVVAAGLAVPGPAAGQARMLPDTLDIGLAVQIALAESPQLRISRTQADQAGADRLAAWGAFLPTASVGASLSRSRFARRTFVGEEGLSEQLPDVLNSSSQSASPERRPKLDGAGWGATLCGPLGVAGKAPGPAEALR